MLKSQGASSTTTLLCFIVWARLLSPAAPPSGDALSNGQPCAKNGAARLGLICRRLEVILMDRPVKTQFVVGHGGVYPLDYVGLFAVGEYRQPTGEIVGNLY